MATSGTSTFTLTTAELLDEAWERCGIEPATVSAGKVRGALRSLNLLFVEWGPEINQWKVSEATQTLVSGENSFDLPAGTIDILQATLKRDGVEVPLHRISRSDWRDIHDKTLTGRPDRYFVDKQRDTKVVYFWQTAENSTDQIVYDRLAFIEDAGRFGATNLDVPKEWLEAMAAGLAAKLALKWAEKRYATLKVLADVALSEAQVATDDNADLNLRFTYRR